MSNFDRRQLRYFVAVAEELHFGNAARRLHISQPPLSQQIAALEADLGARLFARTKRKVEITPAGQQFLIDARAILSDMAKAATRARAAAEGKTGLLRIGLNYTAPLNPVLSTIVHRFGRLYHEVQLELHENTSAKQLDGLYNRTLDLCFVWPTRDDFAPEISLRPVTRDLLRLAMNRDHPLSRKAALSAGDLKGFPIYLSLRQARAAFGDTLLDACRRAGFEPDIRTDVNQLPFILSIATAGQGLAFLPAFLARIKSRGILFRDCRFLPQSARAMPLTIAHRARDPSPLVNNFIAVAEGRA